MIGPQASRSAIAPTVAMVICAVVATAGWASAQTTWHVPDDVGAATIAEALASAAAGDTVVIAPGTYVEHELVLTEGVLLTSALDDLESVIIDAAGMGRVMTGSDLTAATKISSLTLTGGVATGGDPDGLGGAIYLLRSSPTIAGCRLVGNSADYGGGLYLRDDSDPLVTDCRFENNVSASAGGGVFCHQDSAPVFSFCTFAANTALGLGGGLYTADGCAAAVVQCTFADNDAPLGAAVSSWNGERALVVRTLIAENLSGWAIEGDLSSVGVFSCSDIYGNEGGDWTGPLADQADLAGNLSADPFFCRQSGTPSPYSLAEDSPCADAPSGCGQIGAWGVGCGPVVGVPDLPTASRLYPGVPNPFNPVTHIRFELEHTGPTELRIYGIDGRLVVTLVDESLPAGSHQRTWNGTDQSGRRVASGIYFCRLVAGRFQQTQRMALVK